MNTIFFFFFFFAATFLPFSTAVTLDITKYGAKADGRTDISEPLLRAWKDACAAPSASKIVIPNGKFFVNQIELLGHCKSPVELNVKGTIIAHPDHTKFKGKNSGWITFEHLENFVLSGSGSFDGQGSRTWAKNQCSRTRTCSNYPTNIRFNFLTDSLVQDISSINSKMFHLNVLGSKNLTFSNVKIRAPEESINTDGIHIGRSEGITIRGADIQTGDDCISMGDGCKKITVEGVHCGPGHGISIGSLGKLPTTIEPVTGVYVRGCTINNTMNGVRIKTWPSAAVGSASDIHFEDITMTGVGNPVLVDQEYCPWHQCKTGVSSKIKLSNLSFKKIYGTSATQMAVKIVCSKSQPCDAVELEDINLTYKGKEGPAISSCSNVKPSLSGTIIPLACAN